MPKRRLTIHACVAGVLLAGTAVAKADVAPWSGSFAADGQCFCTGSVGREIDSRIVPTPVGGQSVAQVCERVGEGPRLQKVNGKFNYTVFEDRQCGHGPILDTKADQQCLGHLGVAGEDCAAKGPRWDLDTAYSSTETPKPGISVASSDTSGPRYIQPQVKASGSQLTQSNKQPEVDTKDFGASAYISVEEIAAIRKDAQPLAKVSTPEVKPQVITKPIIKKPVPETREQLRARQQLHLVEARERARMRAVAEAVATDTQAPIASTVLPAPPIAAAKSEEVKPELVDTDINSADETAMSTAAELSSDAAPAPTLLSALQFPLSLNRGSKDFDFIEAAPVNYDFGGAGMRLTASKSSMDQLQYFLRASLAESYQEVALGLGYFISPQRLPRLTFMASSGFETGRLEFRDDSLEAELTDTGVFMEVASRFAVSSQFKLQGGVSYSSFFEGDFIGFGEALFNLTSDIDLSARVEAGDNDMLGFGVRYHY